MPFSSSYTFDTNSSAVVFTSVNGPDGLNTQNTDRGWCWHNGSTVSADSGPDRGQGGAGDGYAYIETSSPTVAGDIMRADFPAEDASQDAVLTFEYYSQSRRITSRCIYRLYSNEDAAGWVLRDTRAYGTELTHEPDGNTWTLNTIDLSGVVSSANTQFRLELEIQQSGGSIWHCDPAIDTVTISGSSGGGGGGGNVTRRWTGGATDSGIVLVAKADRDGDVFANIYAAGDVGGSVVATSDTVAANAGNGRVVRLTAASGLSPSTDYVARFDVDGGEDTANTVTFRTCPAPGAASFQFLHSTCYIEGNGDGDDVWGRMAAKGALFFMHGGDFHYNTSGSTTESQYDAEYDKTIGLSFQQPFWAGLWSCYTWSDADFAGNASHGGASNKGSAQNMYRRWVPSHALPLGSGAIYQSFVVGRIRFILTDNRSEKSNHNDTDNASKSVLGTPQKQWFKDELQAAKDAGEAVIWETEMPFCSNTVNDDNWSRYQVERTELMDYVQSIGMGTRLATISGDEHTLAADDGTNTAGYVTSGSMPIPVMVAASLNRPASVKGGPYSQGTSPGPGQYGVIDITDTGGSVIDVAFRGRDETDAVAISLDFQFTGLADGGGNNNGNGGDGGAYTHRAMGSAF